jgi:hypothetical protein
MIGLYFFLSNLCQHLSQEASLSGASYKE